MAAFAPGVQAQTSTSTSPELVALYRQLDDRLAVGHGRIDARARPVAQPEPARAEADEERFVAQTPEAYRRDLDERFRRSIEARSAEQAARRQAFSAQIAEQCGSQPLGPATVGMTVQRFEQCSPEIRFGGGLTHVISLQVQGHSGRLYALNGDSVHRVYAVDGRITRIDPPPLRAVQPGLLRVGAYPPPVHDPQVVALSQGDLFAYGPAHGENWSAPAGADLRAWGTKRGRIHTSVPTPPFLWDAHKKGWERFPLPAACRGLWHQHTLTVLDDDRVLVAGGLCDISRLGNDMGDFDPQVRTALWDARQRAWLDGPDLVQPRLHHTASLLEGQRVMLAGGFEDPLTTAGLVAPAPASGTGTVPPPNVRVLASVEVFGAGRFETVAPLNTARAKHTATVLPSGGVLAAGGLGQGMLPLAQVEFWEPSAQRWVQRSPLRTARYGHTATLLADGRVLVSGGIGAGEVLLNTTELYDPVADAWADGPPLPEHLQGHTSLRMPDGRVLLAGGLAHPTNQTPWLHAWLPGEPAWQALGVRGQGSSGSNHHRPALVPLAPGRVLVLTGHSVFLHRSGEPPPADAAAAGSPGEVPHFPEVWWTPPPAPPVAPAPPPPAGQPGWGARLASDLWSARASLLVLVVVLGGLWLVGRRWAMWRPQPAPGRTGAGGWVVRVLVYGALAVWAVPHLLAYVGLQASDRADQCHSQPSACLDAGTGLLARQWSVPGRSKFSAPRIPCAFVGEWSTRMGTREFTVALQADGTYRMQSPTRSAPEDSGHWAVQGKHMLWRSTRRQSAEMDINRIVANDGQRLELIEVHGVHSHFERRADLPPLRCEP